MRERLSLEQLKAMTNEELDSLWACGGFPFDETSICRTCLTQHTYTGDFCEIPDHQQFIQQAMVILGKDCMVRGKPQILRQHLEELYALRLFYDHLYPQPDPSQLRCTTGSECGQQPATDAFERIETDFHDSRANTR